MNDNHLSAFEQEEYLLDERTPDMLRHLGHCAECLASVTRMEDGLAGFRRVAVEWSDACLSTRPQHLPATRRVAPMVALRWAMVSVLPVVLLVLGFLAFHSPSRQPIRPVAAISDDALLDQVDDQLSVAVPSSMESLTHLVSTDSNQQAGAANGVRGSRQLVQTN